MKTQHLNFKKAIGTGIVVAGLFFVTACGNSNNTSKWSEDQSISEKLPEPPAMDLHAATFMGDVKAIEQHIKAGSDLNVPEPTMGSTALISAAVFGKTEAALALIEAGADVNIKNNEGSTALHSAAFFCRTEIVQALLENGANKTLKNNYGSTAYESVAGSFTDVKAIYDQFSKDLGPFGFKLDYDHLKTERPIIADLLK